ncbi:MAG: glutathione S-transferase [Kofleriaceae bacterium]|nr:glutathione S-transferase [Kofleriaceae bacterium]
MRYELFYWPEIQGRGEFIRLVLEDAGADYVDVAREEGGDARLEEVLDGAFDQLLPFALPVLRAGQVVLSQTAAITSFLGHQLGLAPTNEPQRMTALSYALTIADLVTEVHDTHHPTTVDEAYERQKAAAAHRAKSFRLSRLPKFTGWLERILERNGDVLVGHSITYVDLAAFQVYEGLTYAYPKAMAKQKLPRLRALRDRVAQRPRIIDYLTSDRRPPFNEMGIFRHYPELDG